MRFDARRDHAGPALRPAQQDGPATSSNGEVVTGVVAQSGALRGSAQLPVRVVPQAVRRDAHLLTERLSRAFASPRQQRARRGGGQPRSRPWSGVSDEIDIEATIDLLAASPVPLDSDVIVRERGHRRRSIALAVDISGSLDEDRLVLFAATAAALTSVLDDDVAVTAFWADSVVVQNLRERADPLWIVDRLLAVRSEGLTNVAHGLDTARLQLAGSSPSTSRVILLSDCLHNAGDDPRPYAARGPRTDVLLDVGSVHDDALANDLAAASRGLCLPVSTPDDIVRAVDVVLGDDTRR